MCSALYLLLGLSHSIAYLSYPFFPFLFSFISPSFFSLTLCIGCTRGRAPVSVFLSSPAEDRAQWYVSQTIWYDKHKTHKRQYFYSGAFPFNLTLWLVAPHFTLCQKAKGTMYKPFCTYLKRKIIHESTGRRHKEASDLKARRKPPQPQKDNIYGWWVKRSQSRAMQYLQTLVDEQNWQIKQ